MKNTKTFPVVMLPTKEASILAFVKKIGEEPVLQSSMLRSLNNGLGIHFEGYYKPDYQHLYIISDDEIKEGDYGIGYAEGIRGKGARHFLFKHDGSNLAKLNTITEGAKKVVATTNKSISNPYNAHGNQKALGEIHESFIQAFIKAYNDPSVPNITEVDLEMYEHIIGNKGSMAEPNFETELRIKTRPDNTVIVHQSKMYSRDQLIEFCTKAFQRGSLEAICANSNDPENLKKVYGLQDWITKNL